MADRRNAVRKLLGQFYTPQSEAVVLAAWAVRTGFERILEPSVGDGALLLPALARARELGAPSGLSAIACDVDTAAIKALRRAVGSQADLVELDFFDLDPTRTEPVDVVLANPPFTRNHQLDPQRRADLRGRYTVKGAAGLWAYFVLHARGFLRPGGRMAIVVPGAALFANYAWALLSELQREFRELALLELPNKPAWIGGAAERGAVLLAEGYRLGAAEHVQRGFLGGEHGVRVDTTRHVRLPSFNKLLIACQPLASFAEVSIGAVTGCNRVFLLSDDEAEQAGIAPADLVRVLSRARHVTGLKMSEEEITSIGRQGQKTLLLVPTELGPRHGPVRRRLACIDARARRTTAWFNKRKDWWRVDLGPPGDAVFTYMNDLGPRLCLVPRTIACTNTLHKVSFKAEVSSEQRIAAVLTFVSSFGQLYAEHVGRAYGGGVLKFELKETRSFPILPACPDLDLRTLRQVDALCKHGLATEAQESADELLLAPILGSSWRGAAREMQSILEAKRNARRGGTRADKR